MQYLALNGSLKDFVPGRCAPETASWPPVGAAFTWYWRAKPYTHPSVGRDVFIRLKHPHTDKGYCAYGLVPEGRIGIGSPEDTMICIDASFEEAE